MKNKIKAGAQHNKSFLEWITYFGFLTVFLVTPLLYFGNRLGGAVASKQFFFIGAVNLLLIAWTWLLIKDSRYRFPINKWYVFVPGLLFMVSAAVSTFFGIDPMTSLFSTIGRGIGFIFLGYLYLFSLVAVSLAQVYGFDFFKKITQTGFVAAIVVALSTFFTNEAFDIGSTWLNNTAGGGLLGNSSLAGSYLVFGFFFGLIVFLNSQEMRNKIMAALGLFVIMFSPIFFNIKGFLVTGDAWTQIGSNPLVIIGQARAAAISIVIGLVVSGLVYVLFTSKKAIIKYLSGLLLALGVLATIFIGLQIGVKDSPIQKAFIEQVGGNRIMFWEAAKKGVQERPLIGWGLENFRIAQNKYFNPELLGAQAGFEVWNDKPHNIFIELLVTQGSVGLITYVLLLITLIAYIVSSVKNERMSPAAGALLVGGFIAYILQNQLVFDSISSVLVVWVLIGMTTGLLFTNHNKDTGETSITSYQYVIGGIVTLVCITGWILFAVIPAQKMVQAKKVFDAPTMTRIKNYDDVFKGFGANYIYTDLGIISYTLAETYSNEREEIAVNQKYIDVALSEINTYLTIIETKKRFGQNDYRLKLSEVMFMEVALSLKKVYTEEEANKMIGLAEKAIQLAPTNPLGYLVYGRTLIFADRVTDARLAIDTALALNGTIKQAHDLKNSFERFYGTLKQQREALENAQKYIPGYTLE